MKASLLLLAVYMALIALAPLLAPADPLRTQPEFQFHPPGATFPLGTDALGRDVLSRVLYGGRNTLVTALLAVTVAFFPGVLLGLVAGGMGKGIDRVLSALMDTMLAIPGLITALVVVTLLGRGTLPIAAAVGAAQIAPCAGITRAAVMAARSALYIEASRAAGADWRHIAWEHIVPGIRPTLLAYAGVMVSYAVLNGAALSFLGLGETGVPDWGVLLAEGRAAFRSAPWISAAPGVAITLLVWLVNQAANDLAVSKPGSR